MSEQFVITEAERRALLDKVESVEMDFMAIVEERDRLAAELAAAREALAGMLQMAESSGQAATDAAGKARAVLSAPPAGDGWVPVGERLPDTDTNVLIHTREGQNELARWYANDQEWMGDDWISDGAGRDYVTHWRPLPLSPAPAAGEGEGKP